MKEPGEKYHWNQDSNLDILSVPPKYNISCAYLNILANKGNTQSETSSESSRKTAMIGNIFTSQTRQHDESTLPITTILNKIYRTYV